MNKKLEKIRNIGAVLTVMILLASFASASSINLSTIVDLITEVNTLWTPMLNLIIGVAPLLVTIGFISFILGMIGAILYMVRGQMSKGSKP